MLLSRGCTAASFTTDIAASFTASYAQDECSGAREISCIAARFIAARCEMPPVTEG